MSFSPVHRTSSDPHSPRWALLLPLLLALLLGGLPGLATPAQAAAPTGVISGRVTWHESNPVRKVEVYRSTDPSLPWVAAPELTTYAASNGSFSVRVPAGEPVTLRVSYHDTDHGFFYGGHFTAENAEPVEVAAGRTLSGIDLDVPAPAYLTGRVVNSSGAPISAHVAPGVNDVGALYPLQPAPAVSSRTSGYRVVVPSGVPVTNLGSGLDPEEGFSSSWLTGGGVSEPNSYLELAPGETRKVEDIALPGGVAAVGTVRDRDGLPVPRASVTARQGSTVLSSALTDTRGHYRLPGVGLHQGDFVLEFSGEGLLIQWWRGASSPGDARPISPSNLPVSEATNSVGPFDAVLDYDPDYRLVPVHRPAVHGAPAVGTTLRASTASWNIAPDGVRRQWLRNGTAISGATRATYEPTAADAGRRISVRTTALRRLDGVLRPVGSSVSRVTAPVRARSVLVTSARGRHGRVVVSLRLRTAGAAHATGRLRVRTGAHTSRTARVHRTLSTRTVTVAARRGWRTVRVSYSGSAYATSATRTLRVWVR